MQRLRSVNHSFAERIVSNAARSCRPTFTQIVPEIEEMLASITAPRLRYRELMSARMAQSAGNMRNKRSSIATSRLTFAGLGGGRSSFAMSPRERTRQGAGPDLSPPFAHDASRITEATTEPVLPSTLGSSCRGKKDKGKGTEGEGGARRCRTGGCFVCCQTK
jgi:hypothetical protein